MKGDELKPYEIKTSKNDWIEHESEDLAIYDLTDKINSILKKEEIDRSNLRIAPITTDLLINETFESIGIASPVYLIGYTNGYFDKKNLNPISR